MTAESFHRAQERLSLLRWQGKISVASYDREVEKLAKTYARKKMRRLAARREEVHA